MLGLREARVAQAFLVITLTWSLKFSFVSVSSANSQVFCSVNSIESLAVYNVGTVDWLLLQCDPKNQACLGGSVG